MSIFGAPSTPVAGASALFAPAATTPASVGGTPRATDANGDDARRKSDGWSPASRYQNLLSSVRALEHGRASERDRERARRALRVNETRLREMTFFEGRNAGDAARVASGRATLSHGGEARLGELDVEHASAIAVALDLNEIVSVELMVGAIEHGAPADDVVPAAIGIYMRERAAALESLLAVLRCADGTAPLDGVMDEELKDYADGLLRDGALFARLVKLVTAPPPGGPFLVAPTAPTQHVGGPLALAGQQQQATPPSSTRTLARAFRQVSRYPRPSDLTARVRGARATARRRVPVPLGTSVDKLEFGKCASTLSVGGTLCGSDARLG